jgi:hypothetical protein
MFKEEQLRQLKGAVTRRDVRERRVASMTLHYLEGWKVVTEANRIFGFEGWDRETVASEYVWRTQVEHGFAAAYLTRVRVRVRAGDQVVVREGLGSGKAIAATPGQAHERDSKAAETDATKRALSTFGNRFGLSLYGERKKRETEAPQELGEAAARVVRSVSARMKEAAQAEKVAHEQSRARPYPVAAGLNRTVSSPTNEPPKFSDAGWHAARGSHPFHREPHAGATGASGAAGVDTNASERNGREAQAAASAGAQDNRPADDVGTREEEVHAGERGPLAAVETPIALLPAPPGAEAPTGRIDKSVLTLAEPSRLRDRYHLRYVASQPCLVCARSPSQAHHLRIAQPRALGRKVSDEFTVPLCALHHYDLHSKGNEAAWWRAQAIEPLAIADRLWRARRNGDTTPVGHDVA